ncbi:MAG TPA: histidine phosphatase family protein [Thermoanaerobaculia bacterium]|nr:histidine phosphatase family protein [Thermoanaerobaculia bacterium]
MNRELILVRHGETLHNVNRITQGWSDSDLSERGREQVLRLAGRLEALKPTALYSSPLGRAMSTARAIADATGLEIVPLDDLREMNYGRWEGRAFTDIRVEDEDLYRRWITDEDCPCPEGESHADVRRRMLRVFELVNSERAVLVAHGTAIRIGATALLNLPLLSAMRFAQDNAAMNVFVSRGDHWLLKTWNQTS